MTPSNSQGMSDWTDEELIKRRDNEARSVPPTLNLMNQEIWRRDADLVNRRMERVTRYILWLTGVITFLTLVNVGVFVYEVFSQ
jgi:hypothetical protein